MTSAAASKSKIGELPVVTPLPLAALKRENQSGVSEIDPVTNPCCYHAFYRSTLRDPIHSHCKSWSTTVHSSSESKVCPLFLINLKSHLPIPSPLRQIVIETSTARYSIALTHTTSSRILSVTANIYKSPGIRFAIRQDLP